jgi:glycosyltransferase involved in cell wall biosynthesis
MKLLVFTQALDRNDPVLSAYHRLVAEIATRFESVTAICLKKGDYDLPKNVTVLSLGKEAGESRIKYVKNFYRLIFAKRNDYDAVFVHMNQEYVLLGGLLWRLWGKKVTMWRNHHAGNWLTALAVALCDKIFCTSRYSYTARFKKNVLMPVGIDTDMFVKMAGAPKKPRSILFLARIAPVKKPHVLIAALKLLRAKGIEFTADIYGDPLPKDRAYYELLKQSDTDGIVSFRGGVPNSEAVGVFNAHEIFVNLSSSGMYDKTIFEAMACETLSLASNKNLHGLVSEDFIFEEDDVEDLAGKLGRLLDLPASEKVARATALRQIVIEHHSLRELAQKLARELS